MIIPPIIRRLILAQPVKIKEGSMVEILDLRNSSKELVPLCLLWILLRALWLIWFFRRLSAVADSYDPDCF